MAVDPDRGRALALVPVSRETEAKLAIYVDLLRRWQKVKNLVAPSTLDRVWTRHVADSAQLLGHAPDAKRWVDLGSGAGFPGLVVAIQLAEVPGARVDLVEANARKCAFLREVARTCGAPAVVHNGRIEDIVPGFHPVDIVTARALAPLPRLIEMSDTLVSRGATGLFLKGENELVGLDAATLGAALSVLPSRTSETGRIAVIRSSRPASRDAAEAAGIRRGRSEP